MAAKRKTVWTVRIVLDYTYPAQMGRMEEMRNGRDAWWLGEALRYAGFSRRLEETTDRGVYELRCPHGNDGHVWATQNAERLRSFGLNAQPAPAWDGLTAPGVFDGDLLDD